MARQGLSQWERTLHICNFLLYCLSPFSAMHSKKALLRQPVTPSVIVHIYPSYVGISFKSIEFNNPFALTWQACPLCVALMIFAGFRDMLSKDAMSSIIKHLFLLYWYEGHTKKTGGTNQFLFVWHHTWTGLPYMVTRIRNTLKYHHWSFLWHSQFAKGSASPT